MKLTKEIVSACLVINGVISIIAGGIITPPPQPKTTEEPEERVCKSAYDPAEYYSSRR